MNEIPEFCKNKAEQFKKGLDSGRASKDKLKLHWWHHTLALRIVKAKNTHTIGKS